MREAKFVCFKKKIPDLFGYLAYKQQIVFSGEKRELKYRQNGTLNSYCSGLWRGQGCVVPFMKSTDERILNSETK